MQNDLIQKKLDAIEKLKNPEQLSREEYREAVLLWLTCGNDEELDNDILKGDECIAKDAISPELMEELKKLPIIDEGVSFYTCPYCKAQLVESEEATEIRCDRCGALVPVSRMEQIEAQKSREWARLTRKEKWQMWRKKLRRMRPW